MNATLTASYTDPTGWTKKHFDIASHDDIKTAADGVPESALFVIEIGRTEFPANGRAKLLYCLDRLETAGKDVFALATENETALSASRPHTCPTCKTTDRTRFGNADHASRCDDCAE